VVGLHQMGGRLRGVMEVIHIPQLELLVAPSGSSRVFPQRSILPPPLLLVMEWIHGTSNGSLMISICVCQAHSLLSCLPVVIPVSCVLDIGVSSQRTLVAQHLLSMTSSTVPRPEYRGVPVPVMKVERGRGLDAHTADCRNSVSSETVQGLLLC
jgi:hypothetical protein